MAKCVRCGCSFKVKDVLDNFFFEAVARDLEEWTYDEATDGERNMCCECALDYLAENLQAGHEYLVELNQDGEYD